MEGGGENERKTSPKKRKTTNTAAALPETVNTVDSQAARFKWTIDRFSRRIMKNLYSDVFKAGDYNWRVLIFPKGNNVDYLSLYLDVADAVTLPYGWSRHAQFSIGLIDQINNYTVRKETQHQFNARESDWGFTSFMPLHDLSDPAKGYLVNDTLIVDVDVKVTRNVDEKDTAENLRKRLKKDQEEKNHKNKESLKEQNKANTSKFVSKDFEEIDAMIDVDAVAAIDRVLSEGITLSLKSQHSVQGQEASEQLLQELRDIAFKEDLVEKFKQGLSPKDNFNAVKEKIDANADVFSSHQLEQVGVVVNLLNNIVRMFEKLENLKKEQDSAKKSTDQNNEALKETRQKILTTKTSFTDKQTQLNSLDVQIADLKARLEKLQGDRDKFVEIQDQEKDKITSLNKEVKSIFHRLVDDQVKLKTVEGQIPEAQTELESHEKLYRIFKATPPF